MKFLKVASEYRMISDEGSCELFLLSTGPEANRHFRLISPLGQLDFDAILALEPVPEWQVHRIILHTRANSAEAANELPGLVNPSIYRMIEQALFDFGYFYGKEAAQFGIRFITDQIHRSH